MEDRKSPCEHCTKVPEPRECTYKKCLPWTDWFLARWIEFNNYFEKYYGNVESE